MMEFRLVIAGDLPNDHQLLTKLDEQIAKIKEQLAAGEEEIALQIVLSPSYTSNAWRERVLSMGAPLGEYCMYGESDWDELCTQIIREDTPLRSMLGEEICDKSDLVLMVWNENIAEMDGASWELLQLAGSRKTPCIWISSKTGQVYWAKESLYEWFKVEHLEELCADYRMKPMEPHKPGEKRIPLLGLGIKLRKRYMHKYKALGGKVEAERDELMSDEFSIQNESAARAELKDELLAQFHRYDDSAIELNSRYQAVIYWRAILPFITSVFLAIGFYAENVLGVFGFSGAFWKIVAGAGFLIHGILNLYVYILSRSETIKHWHQGFLHDRYIAEILRVLIHFEPYGINLNLRKLCGDNQRIYMTILRMTGKSESGTREINRASTEHMLDHVEQMLKDQIAYHNMSARRYTGMVDKLEKWYRVVFTAGFVAVVLRAGVQFVWVLWPIGSGELNGIALSKFAGSFANMVAMMLPGWASYFSTKLSQCNFRYNLENHQRMSARLTEMHVQVKQMRQSVQDIPLEALNSLGEELAEIMLVEDTYAWYRQFKTITVKQL